MQQVWDQMKSTQCQLQLCQAPLQVYKVQQGQQLGQQQSQIPLQREPLQHTQQQLHYFLSHYHAGLNNHNCNSQ